MIPAIVGANWLNKVKANTFVLVAPIETSEHPTPLNTFLRFPHWIRLWAPSTGNDAAGGRFCEKHGGEGGGAQPPLPAAEGPGAAAPRGEQKWGLAAPQEARRLRLGRKC
jgi:hypothetical protein